MLFCNDVHLKEESPALYQTNPITRQDTFLQASADVLRYMNGPEPADNSVFAQLTVTLTATMAAGLTIPAGSYLYDKTDQPGYRRYLVADAVTLVAGDSTTINVIAEGFGPRYSFTPTLTLLYPGLAAVTIDAVLVEGVDHVLTRATTYMALYVMLSQRIMCDEDCYAGGANRAWEFFKKELALLNAACTPTGITPWRFQRG